MFVFPKLCSSLANERVSRGGGGGRVGVEGYDKWIQYALWKRRRRGGGRRRAEDDSQGRGRKKEEEEEEEEAVAGLIEATLISIPVHGREWNEFPRNSLWRGRGRGEEDFAAYVFAC